MGKMLYVLFILSLFCLPCFVHAQTQGSVSTGVMVRTDRERDIVFEGLPEEDEQTAEEDRVLTVNKEGTQILSFTEPGSYKYLVYEKKDAPERETREYVLTACVLYNEKEGKLSEPKIIIDNADGSGKPDELYFGEESPDENQDNVPKEPESGKTDPENTTESNGNTESPKSTTGTAVQKKEQEFKEKAEKKEPSTVNEKNNEKKDRRVSWVQTGDERSLALLLFLLSLSITGVFMTIVRREKNE